MKMNLMNLLMFLKNRFRGKLAPRNSSKEKRNLNLMLIKILSTQQGRIVYYQHQ